MTDAIHDLRALFAPRSIAIVGASRTPGSIGHALVANLAAGHFQGEVFLVNARGGTDGDHPYFRNVREIPRPVELAIIAVPAAAVETVLRDCGEVGVRAAVVISAGFGEAGGIASEQRLRDLARTYGIRLVGPNCMGVLSTHPEVRMNATFSPIQPGAGNVSMVTQSGALGLALIDHARARNLGIADFVSIGNRADVSVNDVLAYWSTRPETRVIAMYLESFTNPQVFRRLAPAIARERPIVALEAGRTVAGQRAAASHSAALATSDAALGALFRQTGVTRVNTVEELLDVVSLFATQPMPAGPRVAVVTNAGGPGILFADACEPHGLVLPRLTDATLTALRALLPPHAGLTNPIDMIASAPPSHFEAVIRLVGADPHVDAVVAMYVPPHVTTPSEVMAAIARAAATLPPGKPLATVFLASTPAPPELDRGPRGHLPAFPTPERAARALGAAARYSAWRARPVGPEVTLSLQERAATRAWIASRRPGWLDLDEIAELFALVGLPLVPHRTTLPREDAAVAAARQLGFPVVLKAVAPDLLHKSEAGAVAVGLGDEAAVRSAVAGMVPRLPATALIVQRQAARGVEMIVGASRSPATGCAVLVGVGGTGVELYQDVALRIAPLAAADAGAMLGELRGRALLGGFRGAPAADVSALVAIVDKVAALVDAVPEIAELDLNPVIVQPTGAGAIIVDARVRLAMAT